MGYVVETGRDLTRVIPGVAENGAAQAKVVAWTSIIHGVNLTGYDQAVGFQVGGFGDSPLIASLSTGGGLNPPRALVGLQGFTVSQVIPEPSTAALGLLGAGLLLLIRRRQ